MDAKERGQAAPEPKAPLLKELLIVEEGGMSCDLETGLCGLPAPMEEGGKKHGGEA